MKITFKGLYGSSKKIDDNKRGRSYELGKINAGVNLSDDGLTILITNRKFRDKLNEFFKEGK